MSLSFDDKTLVTAGNDASVRIWDARDLRIIDTLKGHRDAILVFQN
jgi:WD40 repeat protein